MFDATPYPNYLLAAESALGTERGMYLAIQFAPGAAGLPTGLTEEDVIDHLRDYLAAQPDIADVSAEHRHVVTDQL
ncbi:hypothetical protein [Peterkaempfera griseoplana]|uniref:hypothetical protein n=1 Tax=Peterkaempfera griseoplana TaxID=66896 RepID=UPI0006E17891|nr:hypothetical protein [Peterkaempfera griseoplana]